MLFLLQAVAAKNRRERRQEGKGMEGEKDRTAAIFAENVAEERAEN